jgi:carbonic anhydrase
LREESLDLSNKNFMRRIKEKDPTYFDELRKGQHPDYFVLSCSDSRVSPTAITDMPLGRMFVHRNIANQVRREDDSFTAGLYYSLKHLKVKKIIIEGHTFCGGVQAAWHGNEEEHLQPWLNHIRESLPYEGYNSVSDEELARINVLSQVENLKAHPVFEQHGEGVDVIGCLFHVESGEIEWLDTDGDGTPGEL